MEGERGRGLQPDGAPQLPYAPGLDGLRALAVLSVMAFHTPFAWVPGGFYGVDVFFVLSGYLITSLLVMEWAGSGTIRFRRFWARRARRLLPALFLLIAGLGVLRLVWPGSLAWPDPLADALATAGYFANWHFVFGNAGYFGALGPQSPLLHTWSLAIEEQFYLLWPLIVLGVLGRSAAGGGLSEGHRRRRLGWLGALCVVGAVASAWWMWALAANPLRAYYGTDTRAQALLVGAALAVVLVLHPPRSHRVRGWAAVSGVAGLIAVAALWHLVAETSSLAFHGGFMLVSLGTAAVVFGVVVHPTGPASRFLSLRPLRFVGRISYGAYLWYWPVTLVLSSQRMQLAGWPLFACRSAVTLTIAAASSRFVEIPIRRGVRPGWRTLVAAPVAAGVSLALVAVATTSASPTLVPAAARTVASVATRATGGHGTVATKGPPVRVMFVGDSMAGSLAATLVPEAEEANVVIINEGHPGCGVSTDSEFRFLLYDNPPGPPCETGRPQALLDDWRQWVEEYRPDVVVYLARTELFDQVFDGSWTSIGDPAFDRFVLSQLQQGVSILSSEGAKVVLMTSPYYDSTVASDGPAMPEDASSRVADDDEIIEQVARSRAGTTVFPLGRVVTPSGAYQQEVGDVNMRCVDGVHFSTEAGQVIAPSLFPVLARLDRSARVAATADPPPVPAAVPSWYTKLQCGP